MFKKMLAILSTISALTLTTASVVSCAIGPVTFADLMARRVDAETLYYRLKDPVNSWSSGKSMEQGSGQQITNLVDSVLKNDQYNNIVGDIADGWAPVDSTAMQWKIHINPLAEWFGPKGQILNDLKGNKHYMVKAHDMGNTLRYVFNPAALSETRGLWETLIRGVGQEVSQADLENGIIGTGLLGEIQKVNADYAKKRQNETDPVKLQALQKEQEWYTDFVITKYIKGDLGTDPVDKIKSKDKDGHLVDDKESEAKKAQMRAERLSFQTEHPELIMLEVDDANGNVIFNMLNPTEYFDSVLTYVAFAPMPDKAVDWLSGKANIYGNRPEDILNSGPYYVEEFKPQNVLKFRANENYQTHKEDVHIKRIVLHQDASTSISSEVEGFKAGDNSYAEIRSSDVGNWSTYVGNDMNNPNFEGAHVLHGTAFGTWTFLYNYGRKVNGVGDPKNEPTNWAMAQLSTRALISYALDRQEFNRYWTRIYDKPDSQASALSYNRYTPQSMVTFDNMTNKNFTEEGKGVDGISETVNDYTQLVNDQYLMKIAKPAADKIAKPLNGAEEIQKANFGGDLLYHNDYIAYMSLGYLSTKEKENQKLVSDAQDFQDKFAKAKPGDERLQILINKVKYDFNRVGISNKISFRLAINPAWATNLFRPLNNMVNTFNAIRNNPISINPFMPTTPDAYRTMTRGQSDFNIMFGGWSPDFADPSTFLNTIGIGGDYDGYMHTSNAYPGTNPNPNDVKFDQLAELITEYDDGRDKAAKETQFDRYNDFADAEKNLVYKSMLILPIYIRDPEDRPFMGFQDLFTLTTVEIGTSKDKFIGRKMLKKLWTKEEYEAAKQNYEDNRETTFKNIKNTLN